jgi:hypothetical protein
MTAPLPSREREGPIAQQWEGEGVLPFTHRSLTLPQLRCSFPLPLGERAV